MSFSIAQLVFISIFYLFTLFGVAWLTERGWVPKRLVQHPLVYTLSLGVYASSWAFYGAVGMAQQYGNAFLTIYLGLSGAFLLAPVLLYPVLHLTRTHQLSSLADLFAFRFRSSAAGAITTLGLLFGSLPLLALQIQAVAETFGILLGESVQNVAALGFCVLISLFTIFFGARHIANRDKHQGLVFAIAFESLLKLLAIVGVGVYALWLVFSGPSDLEQWLTNNRSYFEHHSPLQEGPWRTMLLLFFASAIVMPHMFHMTFTENLNPRAMVSASWGLPLFLLLMALPIPLILWAGLKSELSSNVEYFTLALGLSLGNEKIALLAFMGGLSAASGVIIVLTLALSGMVLNHLVLPLYPPRAEHNIYQWLKWSRRTLIVAIIVAGYIFYQLLSSRQNLSDLGLIAFAGTLQLLPAALATLYWPKANSYGFISATLAGLLTWASNLLLPLFSNIEPVGLFGLEHVLALDPSGWHGASILALTANCCVLVLVSLATPMRKEEQRAAQACAINNVRMPEKRELLAQSPQECAVALSNPLGAQMAQREVEHALRDLNMAFDDCRPFALRQLRDRIEANLSGLMGPSIARDLVSSFLPYKSQSLTYVSKDIHFIENRLEDYRSRLTGLAAELDALRRYHRQTLYDLPLGVCSLSPDWEVLLWNKAMEALTGIAAARVMGTNLVDMDQPWQQLLQDFLISPDTHLYKQELASHGASRWLNLHKAAIAAPDAESGGLVLLLEDATQTHLLAEKLEHAQRLASLGRLAAGVAHEIGNPITGIACLAQLMRDEHSTDDEILHSSNQIIELTHRVTAIVQSMMDFSHVGSHSMASLNLHELCLQAIKLLELNQSATPVEFINQCSLDHQVLGDKQRLAQVFINLLDNARDASPEQGKIIISSQKQGQHILCWIEDQGAGMDATAKEHLFEPFFTTKDPGQGTGLGLALVFSILKEHQAEIEVSSPSDQEQQRGTKFCLRLPCA